MSDQIKPNEADIVAQHAAQAAQIITLNASVASLTQERDDAKAASINLTTVLEARTGERDALQTKVTTLEAKHRDVDAEVAAKCAKLGISTHAIQTQKGNEGGGTEAKDNPKLTLTQRCLMDKGLPIDMPLKF